jgi:putative cell wall-binding protein
VSFSTERLTDVRRSPLKFLLPFVMLLGLMVVPPAAQAVTTSGNRRIAEATEPTAVSIQISKHFIKTNQSLDAVVIARSDVFADNLNGSALAGTVKGVLLLTDGGPDAELRSEVRNEINRVLKSPTKPCSDPAGTQVYILGGEQAISKSAETTLRNDGWCITRLDGATRVETAISIANTIRTSSNKVDTTFIARSNNFADAATGGACAGRFQHPILVTPSSSLNSAVSTNLFGNSQTNSRIILMGGEVALEAKVFDDIKSEAGSTTVSRLFGPSRQDTAVEIAKFCDSEDAGNKPDVMIVNGYELDTWVYALVGGAVSWKENVVVLYVKKDDVLESTCNYIATLQPGRVITLGPVDKVSDTTRTKAESVAAGNESCDPSAVPTVASQTWKVEFAGGIPGKAPTASWDLVRFGINAGNVEGTKGNNGNNSDGKSSCAFGSVLKGANNSKLVVKIAGGFGSVPAGISECEGEPSSLGSEWDFTNLKYDPATGILSGDYARRTSSGEPDTGTFQMYKNGTSVPALPVASPIIVPADTGGTCGLTISSKTYDLVFTGTTPGIKPPESGFRVKFAVNAGVVEGDSVSSTGNSSDKNSFAGANPGGTPNTGRVVCESRSMDVNLDSGTADNPSSPNGGTWKLTNIVGNAAEFTGDYSSDRGTQTDVGTFTMKPR